MSNKKGCVLSFLLVFFICGVTIPLFMTNHKKVKADTITNLTNTVWYFNTQIFPNINSRFFINFTNNNDSYSSLGVGRDLSENSRPNRLYYDGSTVYNGYSGDDWYSNNYRTITITGGVDVTNSNLITWLSDNAENQTPTPTGTQILYKYWAPYGIITMSDNQVISDNDIQYTVLFNEFTSSYDETTQTGLIFKGVLTEQNPAWSYIESINGTGINILYHGTTNNINNSMWLEFTYGDYMDTDLYNFMELYGHWFDDGDAYIVGMNQGYVEGTEHGRALGQADGVEYTNLVSRIFNGLGDILSIQIFPNITIGLLIGLPLLLGVFVIIIKILRG